MQIKKMERQRSTAARAPKKTTGLYTIGFTDEQVERAKKHHGTPGLGPFMSKVFKLRMWGFTNESLSQFLALMDSREIANMDMWQKMSPMFKELGEVEKTYWSYRAGFSIREMDSIRRLTNDSLKTMVKVKSF